MIFYQKARMPQKKTAFFTLVFSLVSNGKYPQTIKYGDFNGVTRFEYLLKNCFYPLKLFALLPVKQIQLLNGNQSLLIGI